MNNKLAKAGLIIAVASALPLLLYIWFGPADGNPIGLGLLMVLGVTLGLVLLAIAGLAALFRRMAG